MNIRRLKYYYIFACVCWLLTPARVTPAAENPRWFRGQLHAHTYWSDGRGFPEQAIESYLKRGFHFLCITDHNILHEDREAWREVIEVNDPKTRKITPTVLEAYVRDFTTNWVESRTSGSNTTVRLKTFPEIKARFEKPGSFILMPGIELTQELNGLQVHLNYINAPELLPCVSGCGKIRRIQDPAMSLNSLLTINISEASQAASKLKRPCLLVLNHPFWTYYNIRPRELIDQPDIRFFEICNNGSEFPPWPQAPGYTLEKFWDIANAFRLIRGKSTLYGIGSDDAHNYPQTSTVSKYGPGTAWIMVRAKALTPEDIIASMHKGDFYATCGVLLEDISFMPAERTLRVRVNAEENAKYTIHFITTRKNFDQGMAEINIPAEKRRPPRTIQIYSDDIGRVVKTVAGTEADYKLLPEDLYVRARIESDRPGLIKTHFYPKVQTAWTQPYTSEIH